MVKLRFNLVLTSSLAIIVLLSSCEKPLLETDEHNTDSQTISSISFKNGAYLIDTSVIIKGTNKKPLVKALQFEKLIEKKTVAEIPDFIMNFLDNVTREKKFDMTDPTAAWRKRDIIDFCDYGKERDRRRLASKQLVYFGIGKHHALLSYYSGDFQLSQEIVLIEFHGQKITDLWFQHSALVSGEKEIIRSLIAEPHDGC